MRTRLATVVLAAAFAGCSSSPEEGVSSPEVVGVDCELTVVVWSDQLQRPIPATGFVVAVSDGAKTALDTRRTPTRGHTVDRLSPGQYRIKVTHRALADGGKKRVDGEAVIYLEPGAKVPVTVVAVDRKDDMGQNPEDTLPASTPSLPQVKNRG